MASGSASAGLDHRSDTGTTGQVFSWLAVSLASAQASAGPELSWKLGQAPAYCFGQVTSAIWCSFSYLFYFSWLFFFFFFSGALVFELFELLSSRSGTRHQSTASATGLLACCCQAFGAILFILLLVLFPGICYYYRIFYYELLRNSGSSSELTITGRSTELN